MQAAQRVDFDRQHMIVFDLKGDIPAHSLRKPSTVAAVPNFRALPMELIISRLETSKKAQRTTNRPHGASFHIPK